MFTVTRKTRSNRPQSERRLKYLDLYVIFSRIALPYLNMDVMRAEPSCGVQMLSQLGRFRSQTKYQAFVFDLRWIQASALYYLHQSSCFRQLVSVAPYVHNCPSDGCSRCPEPPVWAPQLCFHSPLTRPP